ncbi:hypothetical protein D9M68_573470 [compost metagenome]
MIAEQCFVDGQALDSLGFGHLINLGGYDLTLSPRQILRLLSSRLQVVRDGVVLLVHRGRCFVDDVAGNKLAHIAADCDFALHVLLDPTLQKQAAYPVLA